MCHVPVECDDTCKVLPRLPERSGIVMLKLIRKLEFRGHVYFQAVRPSAFNWFKKNNTLYNSITINIENTSSGLANFEDVGKNEDCSPNDTDQFRQIEKIDDPLKAYRQATTETCLQSVLPDYPVLKDDTNCSLGSM